jgi:hypothetical protein
MSPKEAQQIIDALARGFIPATAGQCRQALVDG